MTRSRARRVDAAGVATSELGVAAPVEPARPQTVAVTGAAGSLGDHVVRALAADDSLAAVIAIDSTATTTSRQLGLGADVAADSLLRVRWRTADARHPSFAKALDGVDVVVHTAVIQDPEAPAVQRRAGNLQGIKALLEAARKAGVRRVVIVSSAMVYGALADNPALLTESHATRAAEDDSIVGDFVRIEALVAAFADNHKNMSIVILRPTTIVGPGCDGVLTRHFETSRLLAIRGVAARWQFVHVADVASACALAVRGALDGVVNVAPASTMSQTDLEVVTGSRRIELPASVAFGAADRLHRAGVTLAPAGELAYLAYPWAIDSGRLYEAGWQPAYDSASALREHLALARAHNSGRRLGRDDATRAAAGATVALLGTAALLRRARRRRS